MDPFKFLNKEEGKVLRDLRKAYRTRNVPTDLEYWKRFEGFALTRWLNTLWDCVRDNLGMPTPPVLEYDQDPVFYQSANDFFDSRGLLSKYSVTFTTPKSYLDDFKAKIFYKDKLRALEKKYLIFEGPASEFLPSASVSSVDEEREGVYNNNITFRIPILGHEKETLLQLYNEKESTKEAIEKCLMNLLPGGSILEDRYSIKVEQVDLSIVNTPVSSSGVEVVLQGKHDLTLFELPASLLVSLDLSYIDEESVAPGGEAYENAALRFESEASK